jgi:hypothetical protein
MIASSLARRRAGLLAIPLLALPLAAGPALAAQGSGGSGDSALFLTSGRENPGGTVTLPLHVGLSGGDTVYYIVTDTNAGSLAQSAGLNTAQKLANAAGSRAVQDVSLTAGGMVVFPSTVDFSPTRQVVPGPHGFPPSEAHPGAVGEPGYSPLIRLPDGTVENAPQVANATGQADKVVSRDTVHLTVTYRETHGFQGGKPVHYISTDASDPLAAALEDATYAPALNAAPMVGDDSTASSRASLAAFTNGQTGQANTDRQGLNSAILDGLDPLNVLRWNPGQGRYSPLWDVHLTQWSAAAVASGTNVVQKDFGQVQNLAEKGIVARFDGTARGTAFGASGFIVDCPIVAFGA